ncbi:NAD(P)/FAD-dependent oxidoreductase [Mycobacterium sp. E2479]|uniref:flavin-containing monooxygenase n=1 Tax=Mycobacterium sp. E2479 TaxID=1834134 RepID=UPI0007FE0313|nr:NAD(P)/FAD-dependent oxidoreductase [Mycobacterium sp. E2479]OBH50442.1 cyclohexanone monooxygenase [Mycobacterium sp. E2479]
MVSSNTAAQNGENPRVDGEADVIVIGAGFAGLYALYRLRGMGLSVVVLDAADDIGGTWYLNRYPGCRCDVESLAYSYSFSPELEQEWDWSERYATQPEILSYIRHVADRFDLRRDIHLNMRVESAHWDQDAERWRVGTEHGNRWTAPYLVTAVGCISAPKLPDIEGLDRFTGERYHTAEWPREGVDFTGKRVAVIGTGSSGVQVIPIIAEQAKQLTVFQRTPVFTIPAQNRPYTEEERAEMKARYQQYREESRWTTFGTAGHRPTAAALEVDEETRRNTYEGAWRVGRVNELLGAFTDLMVDEAANDTAAEFVREKIRTIVKDPDVAASLMPTDYPFGAKRPCMDTNYYQTFNRPNVSLVDLRKEPMKTLLPNGIRTSKAEYPFDTLVLAIGFDNFTGSLLRMNIRGRGGISLNDHWADGARSYLGLAVAGFPNMFTITGPGSPSVLSNTIVSIEQHVDWISACIGYLREHSISTIEARPDAEDSWVKLVSKLAEKTLMTKADSWYLGANVPGKPRVFMAYLAGVGNYRKTCDSVADNNYEGFTLTPAGATLYA